MVAIHRFLCANQGVNVKNAALAEWQGDFHALPQNGLKISNAKYFTETINDAQVGF